MLSTFKIAVLLKTLPPTICVFRFSTLFPAMQPGNTTMLDHEDFKSGRTSSEQVT